MIKSVFGKKHFADVLQSCLEEVNLRNAVDKDQALNTYYLKYSFQTENTENSLKFILYFLLLRNDYSDED